MGSNPAVLRATFVFAWHEGWRLVAVDENVHKLLGYRSADFREGRVTLLSLLHAEDADVASVLFARDGESDEGFNLRLRRACGRIACFRVGASRRVDDGEARLTLVVEDVRSLAHGVADTKMMANFKAMMENSDDFIFFKDRNHVFTGASQTLVAITDPAEHWTDLIGKTDYDVFPEAYADAYYRLEKEVFAGRPVAWEVQEILGKDGSRGWVDNRKYPIRDSAGRIIGLFGIARDISAMKRVEEAQQAALETLQKISARVPGVVFQFRLRPDGTPSFPFASEALRDLFSLRPDEVRDDATRIVSVLHADDAERVRRSIARSARDLTPWQEDYRVRLADGHLRWVSGNALPERENDGSVLWYGFMTDITERKALEEQVRQMAFIDVLTELPNRRLLSDRLAQAMAVSARSGGYGAIIYLDLDKFKPLNDTYGHAVGDMLLVVAADRLRACVRGMDTVARFGGDEFVIMFTELGSCRDEASAQACLIAEKIRSALYEPYVLTIQTDGQPDNEIHYRCPASVGVSLFKGHEASEDDLVRAADAAMYRAKKSGRHAVEMAPTPRRVRALLDRATQAFMQLTWHADFDSGNALLDAQHRALFTAANRLIAAVLAARPPAEVSQLIDRLIADIVRHFADEEAIIAAAGFAGAAAHAALHEELGRSAQLLAEQFHRGTLSSGELLRFLAEDIVARHMLKADREFFPTLARVAATAESD